MAGSAGFARRVASKDEQGEEADDGRWRQEVEVEVVSKDWDISAIRFKVGRPNRN